MEITEKKLKEILTEERQEYQRFTEKQFEKQRQEYQSYMGVLKEDFDSKVQLLGEQYSGIQENIAGMKENITDVKEDMAGIHMEIGGIKSTLASHTEMIGSMMEDMTIVKSSVQLIHSALRKKVDYEEFEALEKRVSALESKTRK